MIRMDPKDFRKLERININRALFSVQGSRLTAEQWRVLAHLSWLINTDEDFKNGWLHSKFNEDVLCTKIGCANNIFEFALKGLVESGWVYETDLNQGQLGEGLAKIYSLRLPPISKD